METYTFRIDSRQIYQGFKLYAKPFKEWFDGIFHLGKESEKFFVNEDENFIYIVVITKHEYHRKDVLRFVKGVFEDYKDLISKLVAEKIKDIKRNISHHLHSDVVEMIDNYKTDLNGNQIETITEIYQDITNRILMFKKYDDSNKTDVKITFEMDYNFNDDKGGKNE